MAKISKEQQARIDGMAYALKVARESGIEGLEKECRLRGALKAPVGLPKKALDEFIVNCKNQLADTFCILTCVTLHDDFGFGHKRLERFRDRFMLKTDCIVEDYATWQENIEILERECRMAFSIRKNDKDVRING